MQNGKTIKTRKNVDFNVDIFTVIRKYIMSSRRKKDVLYLKILNTVISKMERESL